VLPLDVIALPQLKPEQLLGLQCHFLGQVKDHGFAPILLVFQISGQTLALGRYHLYDGPSERGPVRAWRRLSGGRIINPGDGWIGCSLILSGRAALSGDGPKLRPEQVMNRCLRGAMAAMRSIGVDCFYPGRDAITCGGRELAICTFEEDDGGALLFELFIAAASGLESLPMQMDQFDPAGGLTCGFYNAENSTCLARETGRGFSFEEIARRLAAGYRNQFGAVRDRALTSSELEAAQTRAPQLTDWLSGRRPAPALNLAGRQSIQLGSMETRMAVADGTILRMELYGDFIANSPGLAQFERSVAGVRLDLMTLTSAAMQTYGDGSNYILGCGDLTNLARLILSAQ
jgi:hypothetical protein